MKFPAQKCEFIFIFTPSCKMSFIQLWFDIWGLLTFLFLLWWWLLASLRVVEVPEEFSACWRSFISLKVKASASAPPGGHYMCWLHLHSCGPTGTLKDTSVTVMFLECLIVVDGLERPQHPLWLTFLLLHWNEGSSCSPHLPFQPVCDSPPLLSFTFLLSKYHSPFFFSPMSPVADIRRLRRPFPRRDRRQVQPSLPWAMLLQGNWGTWGKIQQSHSGWKQHNSTEIKPQKHPNRIIWSLISWLK